MKKTLALILVLVMILSIMPIGAIPAFAENENEENKIEEAGQNTPTDVNLVNSDTDQDPDQKQSNDPAQQPEQISDEENVENNTPDQTNSGSDNEQKQTNSEFGSEPEQEAEHNTNARSSDEPVAVVFSLIPATAEVTVYLKDEKDPEQRIIIDSVENEPNVYLLMPGEYFYTAETSGYLALTESILVVEPSEQTLIVERELERDESVVQADEVGAAEVNESPVLRAGGQRTITISFNLLGHGLGTGPADMTVPVGSKPIYPREVPYEAGYIFMGWFTTERIAVSVANTATGRPAANTGGFYPYETKFYGGKYWGGNDTFTSDITMYASWMPLVTGFPYGFGGNGSITYSADDYFYYHQNETLMYRKNGRITKSGYDTEKVVVWLWPFDADYHARDRYAQNQTDTDYKFIGFEYDHEIIYYIDEDYGNGLKFWGYAGDDWNLNQFNEVWAPSDLANATYTVTFDANGHGTAPEAQTLKYLHTVQQPGNPSADGYTFTGWYTDSAATELYDFSTMVEESMTLYAGWQANTVTVTFDFAGHGNQSNYNVEVNPGSYVRQPDDPIDDYFTFTGWKAADGSSFNFSAPITANTTITAAWEAIPVIVTFDANGHGTAPTAQTVNKGQKATAPADLTAEHYTFTGWYREAACTNSFDFSTAITSDTTLYAGWKGEDCTVSFDLNRDGATNCPTAQLVEYGKKAVRPNETPIAEGYVFSGWQINGSDYDFSQTVTGDMTLTAAWRAAGDTPYTVEFYKQDEVGNSNFAKDASLTENRTGTTSETATASAKTIEGFIFDDDNANNVISGKISADGSLVLKLYYKVDANRNGIADDEEDYTVSFDSNGGSAVESQSVRYGRQATKPTNPARQGYAFGTWQLDGNEYDFASAVKQDISLKASWKPATDTAYTVEHYEQKEAGSADFTKAASLTDELTGTTGETATAEPKTINGYVYDGGNRNNVTSGTIAADRSLVLKLYYKVDANGNGIADDEEDYTVSFDSNGGGAVESQTVHFGGTATRPADPTMTGYVLRAWTHNGREFDFSTPVKENITLVAEWGTAGDTPYTVEHYKQEEAGSINFVKDADLTDRLTGTTGETATASAKNLNGYVFDNANTNNDVSGSIVADGSLVLKLHYKIDSNGNGIADDEEDYAVDFDPNGGSAVESQSVRFGAKAVKPESPTMQGYVFGTWQLDGSDYDFTSPVKHAITLIATWNAAENTPYTVEHYRQKEAGSDEFATSEELREKLTGTTGETANASVRPVSGYVFDSKNENNVASGTIAADGSLVLKLYYKVDANINGIADDEEDYTVTFDSNGGSAVESQSVHFGDTAFKPEDPTMEGYVFSGWTLNGSEYNFTTPVKEDIKLTAAWNTAGDTPYTVEHYMQNEAGLDEYTRNDSMTENLTGTTGATAAASGKNVEGYVFDTDNSRNVISGTIAADGSLVLKLYYKVDANGNGIPDDEEDFIITFDSNGGSEIPSQTLHYGSTIVKPADPVKQGYVFVHWIRGRGGFDFSTPVTGELTLVAVWKAAEDTLYTVEHYVQVTAGTNDYTKDFTQSEHLTGTTDETATAEPKTINGYVFDAGNENNVLSGTIAADGSLVLKVYYKIDANGNGILDDEENFTVNFRDENDQIIDSQTIHYGDKVIKPTDPQKQGYDFGGWQLDDENYDFNTPVTHELDLKVKWVASGDTPYTVEHYKQTEAGKSDFVKDDALTDSLKGTTGDIVTATAKTVNGYAYDDDNLNNVISGTVAADGSLALKLYYKVDTNGNDIPDDEEDYTVSFETNGGTEVASQKVRYGGRASVPASAPTAEGKKFTGWFKDTECTEEFDFSVAVKADTTVYAGWISEFTVSFNMNGNDKAVFTGEDQIVLKGEKATRPVSDPMAEGYKFLGWTKDKEGTETFDFDASINADTIVYAKWQRQFTVRFDVNNEKCNNTYPEQTLTERKFASRPEQDPTAAGYRFDGWFKDIAGTERFDFSNEITEDTVIFAGWTKMHSIRFVVRNTSATNTPKAQEVVDGGKVTKPENPTANGYVFEGWFTDTAGTNAYDFNSLVTKDLILYDKWTSIKFTVVFNNMGYGPAQAPQTIAYGEKAVEPSNMAADGMVFQGWYTDRNGDNRFDFNTPITGNLTLFAKWATSGSGNTYYNGKGPSTGDVNNPGLFIGLTVGSVAAIGAISYVILKNKKKITEEKRTSSTSETESSK